MNRCLLYFLFIALLSGCDSPQPPSVMLSNPAVKEKILNPLDTILGDKVSDDGKTVIRYNNFESLKKLPASVLKDTSELYNVRKIDSSHYLIRQKKSYITARTFSVLVRCSDGRIEDYYALNDVGIYQCIPVKNDWIILGSDWPNQNIFWKTNNNAFISRIDRDFREIWRYQPNHSVYPTDAASVTISGNRITAVLDVITGCTICYSTVRLTLDENGNYISAAQTGSVNSGADLTSGELDRIFNVEPKTE